MDSIQVLIDDNIAQFIITGSSPRKLQNLLPGRVIKYQMDPIMMTEWGETFSQNLGTLLVNGELPFILPIENQNTVESELESYVSIYLEEEIRKEALVRNLSAFTRFFELACIESGKLISFRNLSREIGIGHTTIAQYFQILEDCMVAERFDPITKIRTRKRLTKSSKYLLFDLGIRRMGAGEGHKLSLEKQGDLFEHWVGLTLKRLTRKNRLYHIKFWRDHDGPEVDWVIEKENHYTPIEVKWTQTPSLKDARHLLVFMDEYDDVTDKGYIVCRTPRAIKLNARITAIPWQDIPTILS